MISSRAILSCVLFCGVSPLMGCSLLYELQPYRMHRWNQGPAPSLDPEFSRKERPSSIHVVKHDSRSDSSTMTANSAEITAIRAQSH